MTAWEVFLTATTFARAGGKELPEEWLRRAIWTLMVESHKPKGGQ